MLLRNRRNPAMNNVVVQLDLSRTTRRGLTVEPRDCDCFEEYCGEEREAGSVTLEEVEDVESSLQRGNSKIIFGWRF